MKIVKSDVVERNLTEAAQWAPRAVGDNDQIFKTKVENRISVDPASGESPTHLEVTFNTSLVWAIADEQPDADDVLDYISKLVPAAMGAVVSPQLLAINGVNILKDATDVASAILETRSRPFRTKFEVPGKCDTPETWTLTVNLLGALLTSDDDDNEHACLPQMWSELMGKRSAVASHFNVGLDDVVFVNEGGLTVDCTQLSTDFISSLRVLGMLKTNGGTISATVSAAMIYEVRFIFDRCLTGSSTTVEPPPEKPKVPSSKPDTAGAGSSAGAPSDPGKHQPAPVEAQPPKKPHTHTSSTAGEH